MVQPYSSTDTVTAWKNSCFILSEIKFPYNHLPVKSSPCFNYAYVKIVYLSSNIFKEFSFFSPRSVAIRRLKNWVCFTIYPGAGESLVMHSFPKGMSIMWSSDSLIKDLNPSCSFPKTITVIPKAPLKCVCTCMFSIYPVCVYFSFGICSLYICML